MTEEPRHEAVREAMEYIEAFGRKLNDYRGSRGRDATRGCKLPGWEEIDARPSTMRDMVGFGDALDELDSVIAKARRTNGETWLTDALGRAEEAEANYAFMVKRAADEKLPGYRELGARCANLERERDEARAKLAEACERIGTLCDVFEVDHGPFLPVGIGPAEIADARAFLATTEGSANGKAQDALAKGKIPS